MVGELGDKTLLASMGLGLEYPNCKIALITGAIMGMIVSNSFAILFGKFIANTFSLNVIEVISNILFIIFGLIGFIGLFIA